MLGNCRLTEECKVNSSGHAVCKCIPIDLCPSNHEPVCGTDAETYQNECRLRVKSCHAGRHDIDIAGHDNCGFGMVFARTVKHIVVILLCLQVVFVIWIALVQLLDQIADGTVIATGLIQRLRRVSNMNMGLVLRENIVFLVLVTARLHASKVWFATFIHTSMCQ